MTRDEAFSSSTSQEPKSICLNMWISTGNSPPSK